jgi:hypothetical protein
MHSREEDTHVFIVRLRREPRELECARAEWRGVIEHVGQTEEATEQRYVKDLSEILPFIAAHLADPGGSVGFRSSMRRWWRRRRV